MKTLTLVLATLVFSTTSAQDYAFKVLISKGQNLIKAGNDWLPIEVGASMDSDDKLKVSSNGYLGLVHVTGKPLEVKEAGQHDVAALAAKIKTGSSVLNKYTDFILSSRVERGTSLTATGAVTRGTGEIKVYLPKPQEAIVFNNRVSFAWSREDKTKVYVVQFNSMFGDELDRFEVQDTTLTIDLNSEKFTNEDNIVLKVFSQGDPKVSSADFVLKKLSAGDKERLTAILSQISAVTQEKNALNSLYLASFYENNALLIDASTAYLEAMRLAPEVPDYREAYKHFVVRNSLKN